MRSMTRRVRRSCSLTCHSGFPVGLIRSNMGRNTVRRMPARQLLLNSNLASVVSVRRLPLSNTVRMSIATEKLWIAIRGGWSHLSAAIRRHRPSRAPLQRVRACRSDPRPCRAQPARRVQRGVTRPASRSWGRGLRSARLSPSGRRTRVSWLVGRRRLRCRRERAPEYFLSFAAIATNLVNYRRLTNSTTYAEFPAHRCVQSSVGISGGPPDSAARVTFRSRTTSCSCSVSDKGVSSARSAAI